MKAAGQLRLGVNIDHVATIRNARGGDHPDPLRAAEIAAAAGADGITAHLREDRRHIGDVDIERLRQRISLPLNLEMAATDEMLSIALRHRPHAACIVPEKREERTTEGGLDAAGGRAHWRPWSRPWRRRASASRYSSKPTAARSMPPIALGAPVVELHTGTYCEAFQSGHGRVSPRARPDRRRRPIWQGRRSRDSCRPWPVLRHGQARGALARDQRTQYRPFPRRRGHLCRAWPRASARCGA